jgi:hypothetical protein
MKVLKCDVCSKDVTNEINRRGYFHIAHRDICEPCYDLMILTIKPVVRTKQPFNYEWYDRLVRDSIERAIAKGKWDTR